MQSQLIEPIVAAWKQEHWDEPARLCAAMSEVCDRERLHQGLGGIMSDERLLSEVASRSFKHPTGASKIVLTDLGRDMPELRLHCWPHATDRSGNEYSIHDHRWSFSSSVLTGCLTHELFELCPAGNLHTGIEFVSLEGSKIYEARALGERRLSSIETRTLRAGDRYFLSSDRLHRMTNRRRGLAVTLFLRGPYRSHSTTVYHQNEEAILAGQYPPGLDLGITAELLGWIAKEVEAGGRNRSRPN